MPGWLGKAYFSFLLLEWINRRAGVRCWDPARSLSYPWYRILVEWNSTGEEWGPPLIKNRDPCCSKAHRWVPLIQTPSSWPQTHYNYPLIVTSPAPFYLHFFPPECRKVRTAEESDVSDLNKLAVWTQVWSPIFVPPLRCHWRSTVCVNLAECDPHFNSI